MIDPKAQEIDLTVAGRDFTIEQSPSVLNSNRAGGTTGAVIWQTSVRLANWLGGGENAMFKQDLLNHESVVLELGAGTAGILACTIAGRTKEYIATDQQYAMKLLGRNIRSNDTSIDQIASKATASSTHGRVSICAFDWEHDSTTGLLHQHRHPHGVDVVMSCDCIYNYAMIRPFVETCADVCKARSMAMREASPGLRPTVCVIAQHLRQPEVFEEWLSAMTVEFRLWRVREELLDESLQEGNGFAVHLAVLSNQGG